MTFTPPVTKDTGPLRPVSQPNDHAEREADRAAEEVVAGKTVSWSLTSTPTRSVQRQKPDDSKKKPKSDADKYKEAAKKTKKALRRTETGKALEKKILDDPVVRKIKDAVTSPAGIAVTTALGAGGVGLLAATGKDLPFQPPAIPLDRYVPGLSAQVTYTGPVNSPTFVGVALVHKPKSGASSKSSKEEIAADIARLRREQAMFRATIQQATTELPPTSPVPGPLLPLKQEPASKKEEEPVHRSAASASPTETTSARVDHTLTGPGRPIEAPLRADMEAKFGYDFSKVRIHDDSRAAAVARSIDASAFTVGTNVVLGSRHDNPATSQGRHILAHELAHVVQQSRQQPPVVFRQRASAAATPNDLQGYLANVRTTGSPLGTPQGRKLARGVVESFGSGDPAFSVLAIPERVVLVKELIEGGTSADQIAILYLFEEALAHERIRMSWSIGEDELARGLPDKSLRRQFDSLMKRSYDTKIPTTVTKWTVPEVVRILERHGDKRVISHILARKISVVAYGQAFKEWILPDGEKQVEESKISGLADNKANTIFIKDDLTSEEAAAALYHEHLHTFMGLRRVSPEERLQHEIDVWIGEEEFRLRHGLAEARPGFRKDDDTVDPAAVRQYVDDIYRRKPTDQRDFAGYRLEGKRPVWGWRSIRGPRTGAP